MENMYQVTTNYLQALHAMQQSMLTTLDMPSAQSETEEVTPREVREPMFGIPSDDSYTMLLAEIPHQVEDGQEQSLPRLDLQMINEVIGSEGDEITMETCTSQGIEAASLPHTTAIPNNMDYGQLHDISPPSVRNPFAMISGVVPDPMFVAQAPIEEKAPSPMISPAASPADSTPASPQKPPEMGRDIIRDEQTTQASSGNEAMNLPDDKQLLIRMRFCSREVVREHVSNPNGCLVYFNKPWQFNNVEAVPTGVEFPKITAELRSEMTERRFKLTDQVLKALEKGLYLRCDENNNVYATRFCKSKIFWCSTEKGQIADGERIDWTPQKLERNEEVMVFDNKLFEIRLFHYLVNKPTFKKEPAQLLPNNHVAPISPAVFFTFAQPWNPMDSALSTCLVSMIVNPLSTRMKHKWANGDNHDSYNVSDYRPKISKSLPSET